MNYAMYTARKDGFNKPGGVIGEKLGGGVRPTSKNPYPIVTKLCDFPYPIYDLTKNPTPKWPKAIPTDQNGWKLHPWGHTYLDSLYKGTPPVNNPPPPRELLSELTNPFTHRSDNIFASTSCCTKLTNFR